MADEGMEQGLAGFDAFLRVLSDQLVDEIFGILGHARREHDIRILDVEDLLHCLFAAYMVKGGLAC